MNWALKTVSASSLNHYNLYCGFQTIINEGPSQLSYQKVDSIFLFSSVRPRLHEFVFKKLRFHFDENG